MTIEYLNIIQKQRNRVNIYLIVLNQNTNLNLKYSEIKLYLRKENP